MIVNCIYTGVASVPGLPFIHTCYTQVFLCMHSYATIVCMPCFLPSWIMHIHIPMCLRIPPEAANFLWKSDCLGCAVLLSFVVCLTLLASFFLPSASLQHVYTCSHYIVHTECTCTIFLSSVGLLRLSIGGSGTYETGLMKRGTVRM